ncbi:flavin-containing monooxygenase [Amycolatopsis saalfeldensis]|uniref:Putative flavoprotein involved in K+ transport n=1 Tax=Amycolatopsis saalfeldensis TaxID=394193 RepID=A0A1H8YM69_9PSEU|nr:NAD(P)/FAD-dependent oxidoreductase [Amycolatopsis saalfeldensis]SEP53304.1 putative flavoprotein involved in K+ transport [Amycolatopsis saalfeldensis]
MTVLDVAVVGGGQAGLAIGYHLRARGLDFEILDGADSVGHMWRTRWDSLRLFTPAQYAGLPGLAFPAAPDTYPTKDQVADYLRTYASHFTLPIRLGTTVTELAVTPAGNTLTTAASVIQARQVVVATGPFQIPVTPACGGGFSSEVLQLHSSCYRNPEPLRGLQVLVVGGGNSGFQLATELATDPGVGAVTLASGTRNACVPQRILGRDLFWWQTITGLISAPADSRRGRWLRRGEGTVIGLSHRDLRRADITVRPRLTSANRRRAGFADGSSVEIDAVVWATGYRRDHTWITVDNVLDHTGALRHHRGVTPATGLYVLGQPWQHTTGSALLGFVQHDAAYLAQRLTRRT